MSNGHHVSVRTPNTGCTGAFLLCCNKVESCRGQNSIFWVCSNFSYFTGEWFVLRGCRKVRNSALSASSASAAPCTPFVSSLSLFQKNPCQIPVWKRVWGDQSLLLTSPYRESTVALVCREGRGGSSSLHPHMQMGTYD